MSSIEKLRALISSIARTELIFELSTTYDTTIPNRQFNNELRFCMRTSNPDLHSKLDELHYYSPLLEELKWKRDCSLDEVETYSTAIKIALIILIHKAEKIMLLLPNPQGRHRKMMRVRSDMRSLRDVHRSSERVHETLLRLYEFICDVDISSREEVEKHYQQILNGYEFLISEIKKDNKYQSDKQIVVNPDPQERA